MMAGDKCCALIGASNEAIHPIHVAKELGYRVVALDGNPEAEGLRFADEAVVIDIRNAEAVEAALKERCVSFLLPAPIGRWLSTAGSINDALGLVGFSHKSVLCCVDKLLFHETMAKNGLRRGVCRVLGSTDVVGSVGSYPVIVKPRFGSGSKGVFLAETADVLTGHVNGIDFSEEYIVETAAQGVEFGLDAAIVGDEFHVTLLREKVNTPPPVRQCIGYYSVPMSDEGIYERVANKMEQAVRAVGLKNCILHADLMIDDDDVFIIEMSPRPSGHRLSSTFTPKCTGVDPVREFVVMAEGGVPAFTPGEVKQMFIRFFDMAECTLTHVPDEEDLSSFGDRLVAYECNVEPGQWMGKVCDGNSIIGRGYAIFEGSSRQELNSDAEMLMGLFERSR